MKILLNQFEDMGIKDDWYTIIRAEHEGKEWYVEERPNCFSYRNSERLSDDGSACIEGNGKEMVKVASAIERKSMVYFKRIAVVYAGKENGFYFWSPKNSKEKVLIPLEDAEDLMRQIYEKLGKNNDT